MKILRQVLLMSTYVFWSFCLQAMFAGLLLANDGTAQAKKLDEIQCNFTLKSQELTLKKALNIIERETGFDFAYNNELNLRQKVTLISDATLYEVLSEMSKSSGLYFKRINNSIYVRETNNSPESRVSEQAFAPEQVRVSGKVTSVEDNEPLPGVSILVKGTSTGTTTDIDGNYSLSAPEGSVLQFSYIGFLTQEVTVGNQSSLNIALETDLAQLEEVVVVGYGSQSRINVTGSVAKVDVDAIKDSPNTNITQALRNRVAGVQFQDNGRPGQGGSIIIRGRSSITASNNPLIIVDGVFFNGSIADINPNDVQSMEVLKDASSTAIYGARAANGVILVTTKKGTSKKPTINFNASYGVSEWTKELDLLSPDRYVESQIEHARDIARRGDPDGVAPPISSFQVQDLLESIEFENFTNGNTINPWDEIKQDAYIANYDVNISGKLENTNYYLSAAYTDEKGIIVGDDAQRVSFRANLQTSLSSWLNIGVTSQFTKRDLSGIEANLGRAYRLSPYGSLFNNGDRNDLIGFPQVDQLVINPLLNSILDQNEEVSNNLFANFFATIDFPFLKGLSYQLNASPNLRWNNNYLYSGNVRTSDGFSRLAIGQKSITQRYDWVIENILKYEFEVGDIHDFDITLLYGRNQSNFEETIARGQGFATNLTGWDNLNLAESQITQSNNTQFDQISTMARLNYRLMDKYLFTFTARRDGASVFGDNNKFGVFPSAAFAWIASNEEFIKNADFINLLKFRASYGQVGNQALSPYSTISRYSSNNAFYVFGDGGTSVGLRPSQIGNSELGWETTTSTNLAVDFGLMDSRISGTIEYYNSSTEDLLLFRNLPEMSGFGGVIQNIGETENEGIEITLNTLNLKNEKFSWSSDFMFSSNRNEIVSLTGQDLDGDGMEDDIIANNWLIGEPVSVEFDFQWDGIWQEGESIEDDRFTVGDTKIVDTDGDGQITDEDRTVIGQRDPQFIWGFGQNFTYGNFEFSIFINGQHGMVRRFTPLDPSAALGANFPGRANMLDAGWWTPENKSNARPSLGFVNPLAHGFYADRDFIRIQDISLAYNFPSPMLDKLKVQKLKVFLTARNLATFTDWPGWDPEVDSSTSGGFPAMRTFMGGINLGF